VVYADSGSTDGSRDVARERGIHIVELNPSTPFSAARGRNEGLAEALRHWPDVSYVIFLDGDCILDPEFPSAAAAALDSQPNCAIVTGHLTERCPDASVYNRLCAIEWRSPVGRIDDARIGGIMAARISALREVGGFNEQLIAGEEPDLAARLGRAGYTIFKIDVPMAVHDAQMLSFGQWWKRAIRSGHGLAHLFERHRRTKSRLGARELRSAIFWGFAVPLLTLALLWPTHGLSLLLLGGYALLSWRVFQHYSGTGLSRSDAWLMTRFILYSKFAEFVGILRYCINRLRGSFSIIEYK
jgi:GT2 family glycosyltransferase